MKIELKTYKVIVTGATPLTGDEDTLEFSWSFVDRAGYSTNFASGFVEALEWMNGYTANRPHVQETDGYYWNFECGKFAGMTVRVTNEHGETLKESNT